MHDLSSVTTSRSSISRIDRDFRFLKPDNVGGLFDVADFLDVLDLESFGGGGGGGNNGPGGGTYPRGNSEFVWWIEWLTSGREWVDAPGDVDIEVEYRGRGGGTS